jgi:hypothetical protein
VSRGPRQHREPPQNLGILRPYDPFAQFRAVVRHRETRRAEPERDYRKARLFTESLSIGLAIAGIVLVAVTALVVVLLIRSF